MARRALIGAGVAVAFVALVAGASRIWGDELAAEGRPTDACPGPGTVGLVGLDLETGAEQWTNVVGDDVQNVWSTSADGDPTAAGATDAFVIDRGGRVRRVEAASGDVTGCGSIAALTEAEIGTPVGIDATGATVREQIVGVVDATERDGSPRWRVEGRNLVGSSPGGVVVSVEPAAEDAADWDGRLQIEVLDPASGEVRWDLAGVSGQSPLVTADHLVVLAGTEAIAYDLADGREVWTASPGGTAYTAFADDGRVFVFAGTPGADPELSSIDEATGKRSWTRTIPEPGRGGEATETGGVVGVAVADGTVVLAIASVEPYRD